jgi:hypothetical protein
MRAVAVHRGSELKDLAGRVLCHDVRGMRNEIVFRKGHVLQTGDLPALADGPWSELHLLELGPDDLGQREAGEQLAAILEGDGLTAAPSGHRHVLKARRHGLLRIDITALREMNSIPGIAVYTRQDGDVVNEDQVAADAQITPLAIDRRSIEAAAEIAAAGRVIRLLPFTPRDAILWMRDDRHVAAIEGKLRSFDCRVHEVVALPRDAVAIYESIAQRADSGATLYLISGSNALDPLDPVFAALETLGATMQRVGLPVHPGTLLWLASWQGIPIIGLPTCGLGTQVTAFDLVLPKILAEGSVCDDELAAMGHGGILKHEPLR